MCSKLGQEEGELQRKCCLWVVVTPLLSPGNAGLVGLTDRSSVPGHIGVGVNVRGGIGGWGY